MPDQAEKLKRLTIDLTGDEHRVLKAHAAEAGVSMRDLVLEGPAPRRSCSLEPSKEPDGS
jgi:hypothetical protein